MAEHDRGATSSPTPSTATPGGDLVSLDEGTQQPLETGAGASSQDSILNAAEMFQQQLEQMTAWKHQLAQQMELMRRDGVKLLERQKTLALEKKKVAEDREALASERGRIQQLQSEAEAQSRQLAQRAAEIAAAETDLRKLESERGRWEMQLASAREEIERLAARKSQTASELAAGEARLQELQAAEGQYQHLKAQIGQAEAQLADLHEQQRAIEATRHDLDLKNAELLARQKSLADQEAHCLAEDVRLKEGLEQLEVQRRQLVESQRHATQDREAAAAHQQQLAARERELAQQAQELASREESIRSQQKDLENARQSLQARQSELGQRDQALAQKAAATEGDLRARLAEAETLRNQAAEDRQAALKQRQELQRKLEALDQEHADQLESLARQTKRLSERRAEIEAAERDIDKALEERIAKATGSLQGELAAARTAYEQKIATLEAQISASEASSAELRKADERLTEELAETSRQLAAVREELHQAGIVLAHAKEENVALARDLSAQLDAARQEAARWQAAVESARAESTTGDEQTRQSRAAAEQARAELEAVRGQLAALQNAHEELQFKLELQADDARRAMEAAQAQLSAELQARDAQIVQWQEKYQAAVAAAESGGKSGKSSGSDAQAKVKELASQLAMLEQQRDELANQLFTIQDNVRRQQEEAILATNVLEGKLLSLEQKNAALEAEKSAWKSHSKGGGGGRDATPATQTSVESISELARAQQQMAQQRERLLRRARALRGYRQQTQETRQALENSREEIAQQREQLRARKENLEQVKRLLEKQEMVMARKLADHNAIKTVAAVGIFVIMILGSAFFGVYRFMSPVFRSEAVVQLTPPAGLQGLEAEAWLSRQMEFVRSPEVTHAAWKVLRSAEEHYAMHDVRDEWLGSINKHLSMQIDSPGKTLSIRYSGPNATGVSQVCNALAAAYSQPSMREVTEQTKNVGAGAQVLAKATPPLYPAEDHRLMVSMSVVAVVLFVSLLLVMIFRHFVARQLREIDQMADQQDLEELGGDLAETTPKPAV